LRSAINWLTRGLCGAGEVYRLRIADFGLLIGRRIKAYKPFYTLLRAFKDYFTFADHSRRLLTPSDMYGGNMIDEQSQRERAVNVF
jgi:hypothetical protein